MQTESFSTQNATPDILASLCNWHEQTITDFSSLQLPLLHSGHLTSGTVYYPALTTATWYAAA